MKGKKAALPTAIEGLLSAGREPGELIDTELIPAITRVGELFERKIFFLPQLIAAAETMEQAVAILEPKLQEGKPREKLETVVMATVEGDVHDIGKNLVVLMLKNYGYDVIDLGKDVPTETIVARAAETKAAVIGLSALMTTTMTAMPEVVKQCREQGVDAKIIVGGACVTKEYAEEIGADGYSDDASAAVTLVNQLLGRG